MPDTSGVYTWLYSPSSPLKIWPEGPSGLHGVVLCPPWWSFSHFSQTQFGCCWHIRKTNTQLTPVKIILEPSRKCNLKRKWENCTFSSDTCQKQGCTVGSWRNLKEYFRLFPRQHPLLLERCLLTVKAEITASSSRPSLARCCLRSGTLVVLPSHYLPHNQWPLNLVIHLTPPNILRWFIVNSAQGCELDNLLQQRWDANVYKFVSFRRSICFLNVKLIVYISVVVKLIWYLSVPH